MNIERIKQLIETIRPLAVGQFHEENTFNMNWHQHNCGTPSCLSGWTNFLAFPEVQDNIHDRWKADDELAKSYLDIRRERLDHALRDTDLLGSFVTFGPDIAAERWLELTEEQANDLFYPANVGSVHWGRIGPEEAIKVLEHLIETGEVDWSVGVPQYFLRAS